MTTTRAHRFRRSMLRLSLLGAAAALCLLGGSAGQPALATSQTVESMSPSQTLPRGREIYFNTFPKGAMAQAVREIWKKHPEYGKIWTEFKEVPNHAIGVADVNGDNQPEIFVRHNDVLWGFCDSQGYACAMNIYANTKRGLVELGSMMAADPVIVLPTKTRGVNDLFVIGPGNVDQTYVWNGKRYELRK